MAGITALQALRKGQIRAGHKVLINGASGGVGTFAVQIAKAMGTEVTGVCSTRNTDLVRSLGAEHVIDYTHENYADGERHYDLILDLVGTQSLLANRRTLTKGGVYVAAGSINMGNWISPITGTIKVLLTSLFGRRKMVPFLAGMDRDDLIILKDLVESGKVTPVVDRSYPLADVPEAIRYLEEGHVPGKVAITVTDDNRESS
jgi:NADPH:quinone reductase-like Zn-dependent oxidoreductase